MESTSSQTRGIGWGTAQEMVTYDLLFHLFFTFAPLLYVPKITRLNKIYILTRKSSLLEGNFIPSCRNTLGYLLLDTLAYPPKFILHKYKETSDIFCTYLFFASSSIQIFCGVFLHSLSRLLKFKIKWLRMPTTEF